VSLEAWRLAPPMPASEPLRGATVGPPRQRLSEEGRICRGASRPQPHHGIPARVDGTLPKRSSYMYRPAEIAGSLARAGNATQLVEDARSRALRGLAWVFGSVGGTPAALD